MSSKREIEAGQTMYDLLELAESAAEELKQMYFQKMQLLKRKGIYSRLGEQTGLTALEAKILAVRSGIKFDEQNILSYAKAAQNQDSERLARAWTQDANWKKRRNELIDLINTMTAIFLAIYEGEIQIFEKTVRKIGRESFKRKAYEIQKTLGYAQPVEKIAAEDIDKLMANRWRGATYSDRIWDNTQQLADKVREVLLTSFISGKSTSETWRVLEHEFQKGLNNARRVIRTEAAYMANIVQLEAYRRNGVEKYEYCAILDWRTSEMCRNKDGTIYNVKDAVPGVNFPPLHPWCRSTTMPVKPKRNNVKVEQPFGDMTLEEWTKQFLK